MKFVALGIYKFVKGRAPQGARGLKSDGWEDVEFVTESRPARGAWVEICPIRRSLCRNRVAPRKGRVG